MARTLVCIGRLHLATQSLATVTTTNAFDDRDLAYGAYHTLLKAVNVATHPPMLTPIKNMGTLTKPGTSIYRSDLRLQTDVRDAERRWMAPCKQRT
jgi:hypothetical protein